MNQKQNSDISTALPYAPELGSHPKAAWHGKDVSDKVWQMSILQTEKWEMGRLTNFPPTPLLSSLEENHLCCKCTLTEEGGLAAK